MIHASWALARGLTRAPRPWAKIGSPACSSAPQRCLSSRCWPPCPYRPPLVGRRADLHRLRHLAARPHGAHRAARPQRPGARARAPRIPRSARHAHPTPRRRHLGGRRAGGSAWQASPVGRADRFGRGWPRPAPGISGGRRGDRGEAGILPEPHGPTYGGDRRHLVDRGAHDPFLIRTRRGEPGRRHRRP